MKRLIALAALAAIVVTTALVATSGTAWSQLGYLVGVRLQSATPGTPDAGHANISGTLIAARFSGAHEGNGSSLTNLDASDLASGTVPDARLSTNVALLTAPLLTFNAVKMNAFQLVLPSANGHLLVSDSVGNGSWQPHPPGPLSLPFVGASSGAATTLQLSNTGTGATIVADNAGGNNTIQGSSTVLAGQYAGGHFSSVSVDGRGVMGLARAAGAATNFGGHFEARGNAGRGVYGWASNASGTTYGGYFESDSTQGAGIFARANAGTGSTFGILARSASTAGIASYGHASALTGATYGGYFQSASSSGTGVYGLANSSSGAAIGVSGQSDSPDGVGVYGSSTTSGVGVRGAASGITGRGIHGQSLSASGATYAGYFEAQSPLGCGVFGDNSAVTNLAIGVFGRSASVDGRAVYGLATTVSAAAVPYGVVGSANPVTAGYAVYAFGDMGASGLKPFRIDHPFDPENKYLLHYAAEGPVPQNVYNGIVVTDDRGYAWVELPAYFEEINKDFRYTLTVIDDSEEFILTKVTREVAQNKFQVRTSRPNVRVSWEVKGTRNDLYARFKQPKDEIRKTGPEKGKYQHPELYGLPDSMGMNPRQEPHSKSQASVKR